MIKSLSVCLILCLIYNVYFILLLREKDIYYLFYLDFLLALAAVVFVVRQWFAYRAERRNMEELLQGQYLIYQELGEFENREIAEHDIRVLEAQLKEQTDLNYDFQDYVTKWCHEVKLPLAAALLMNERVEEPALRRELQEQLERINQQMNMMLVGCKVQNSFYDLQMRPTKLMDCVRTSIRNQQFFLIKQHFTLDIRIKPESDMTHADCADAENADCTETGKADCTDAAPDMTGVDTIVYTDKEWLVYVLDQLISNAVKYAGEAPFLKIWAEKEGQNVSLFVEDHGEGILPGDLGRVFERGFTGRNHHNGKYKSTGMGLYMAKRMIQKLGHTIEVESEYGSYTRFRIGFTDNREYFNLSGKDTSSVL
ncbi:MAG: sensor histidine kinase [Lachnospiraceae bacterium]|nr:sensor histidine kinase [Lachnospiraceae bacterium]